MAALKVKRGKSANIGMDQTPFEDGCLLLTTDSGQLFIDATDDDAQKRILINPHNTTISATLSQGGWETRTQTISDGKITESADGFLAISPTATEAQQKAAVSAKLTITAQAEGSLTIKCLGIQPGEDIPVSIVLF